MNPAPTNQKLFWTLYTLSTLGPILGAFLLSLFRPHDDGAFLLSWLLWFFGAGLLIACVWSVRTILLNRANSRRPAWLYRTFGWLALVESLIWAYTVVRVI
jgi:hypothetical protein